MPPEMVLLLTHFTSEDPGEHIGRATCRDLTAGDERSWASAQCLAPEPHSWTTDIFPPDAQNPVRGVRLRARQGLARGPQLEAQRQVGAQTKLRASLVLTFYMGETEARRD